MPNIKLKTKIDLFLTQHNITLTKENEIELEPYSDYDQIQSDEQEAFRLHRELNGIPSFTLPHINIQFPPNSYIPNITIPSTITSPIPDATSPYSITSPHMINIIDNHNPNSSPNFFS